MTKKKAAKNMITPLHDRVIVKPKLSETQTSSGIIIPDTAIEKPIKGTVMFCGKGRIGEPLTVKVNDNVLYSKRAGTEVEVNGEKLLIMKECDILAII